MRCPKLVLSSNGLLLDLGLLEIFLVQIFQAVQSLLSLLRSSQISSARGKCPSINHGVGRDEEEGGSHDEIAFPLGLLLGIFERIDVLGYAFHIHMVVLHFILQIQQTKGMEDTT